MRNPKLIDQLTTNLEAVTPISPLRNTVIWSAVSLAFVAVGLTMMQLRQISDVISQPMSVISGLWFLVNSFFLAFAASVVGQPGRKNQGLILSIGFATYLLLIGVLLGSAITLKNPMALSGMDCIIGVGALSVMPLIFFLRLVRKLAPTSPWLMGLLLGISTSALGAFGIGFSCAMDDPLHLLVFHFVAPAMVLGGIGAFAGKKWLRW
ncbi:MAG: DUF1109 family protein [Bdellovibrionales bacterium]|nr:DUF1109 family protein [Bdellovibrionales bacterium]